MLTKKWLITGIAGVLSGALLSASDISEEWLDRLKDIVGDAGHTKCQVDNVRETKYPGETYVHNFNSDIVGSGRAVTTRSIKWFSTKKTINLHHISNAIVIEKIISTQDELNAGTIRSEFTVQSITETIKSANGKIEIGPAFDSAAVCSFIKTLAENSPEVRATLNTIGGAMFAAGMTAITAPVPEFIHKVAGAGTAILGAALRGGVWLLYEFVPKNTDEDGNWILSEKTVKNKFPGYNKVVLKLRKVAGTKVRTIWEYDKGYSSVKIINPDGKKLDEKDKELIAKMIYRTNPVGGRFVFPAGYEKKDRWIINTADIGGMLFSAGIDYDSLAGTIGVRNSGISKRTFEDEAKLNNRKAVDVLTVRVDQARKDRKKNEIIFKKTFYEKSSSKKNKVESQIEASITPVGHMLIMLADTQSLKSTPIYVREAHFTGNFAGKLEKEAKSLFAQVEFEESSMNARFDYVQLRQSEND